MFSRDVDLWYVITIINSDFSFVVQLHGCSPLLDDALDDADFF